MKSVLQYLEEYDIPRLKCELLGHHIENFKTDLREIVEPPVGEKLHYRHVLRDISGEKPTLELTREQERINIEFTIEFLTRSNVFRDSILCGE